MSRCLLALATKLRSHSGHFSSYYQWMEQAAKHNSWKFEALVPENHSFRSLPRSWSPCLPCRSPLLAPRCIRKRHDRYLRAKAIRRKLKLITGRQSDCLLFHECFDLENLAVLGQAVAKISTQHLSVCLLYRAFSEWTEETVSQFSYWNQRLQSQLGPDRFFLVTDCQQSIPYFTDSFAQPLQVLPVIHALPHMEKGPESLKSISCWSPGVPKENKGIKVLGNLLSRKEVAADGVVFFVPKEVEGACSGGAVARQIVDTGLSRDEYIRLLSTTDVVVLPYSPQAYSQKTSGVFVEAVSAGKLPLVTRGTWMASELERFRLPELIVDWNREDFYAYLVSSFEDLCIRSRLKTMQIAYQQEHSVQSLARCFEPMMPSRLPI